LIPKFTPESHTIFTLEIIAKHAESAITVLCKPLAANSFARRCPRYLIAYANNIQWFSEEYKQRLSNKPESCLANVN